MQLYKYQSASHLSLSSLINGYSWYSKSADFNDPFDTAIIQNSYLQEINCSKEYILCLSAVVDNLLMWSHYADGHRGYCVEYTEYSVADILDLKATGIFPHDAPNHKIGLAAARPVEYLTTEEIESIVQQIPDSPHEFRTLYDGATAERKTELVTLIQRTSFIKHLYWSYEQEYRLINTKKSISALPGRLSAIYFGLKMSALDKRTVGLAVSRATNNQCRFYQMFRPSQAYGLSFREFNPISDMEGLPLVR